MKSCLVLTVLLLVSKLLCSQVVSIDSSYQKGIHYYNNKKSETPLQVMLLANYLKRELKIDVRDSVLYSINTQLLLDPNKPEHLYKRMYWNDSIESFAKLNLLHSRNDSLTFLALYCDIFGLSADSICNIICLNAQYGGYMLSNALLAFYICNRNGCIKQSSRLYKSTFKKLREAFETAMLPGKNSGNKLYEIIAFGDLIGIPTKYSDTWISPFISEQLPNGSWSSSARSIKANDHSTFLALMILHKRLETKH